MLSRTQGVMFKVKLLFAKNYLPHLRITLWLVYLNTLRFFVLKVQRSEKVSKLDCDIAAISGDFAALPTFTELY